MSDDDGTPWTVGGAAGKREAEREERYQNEVIRAGAHHGMSILNLMQEDLVEAWIAHDAIEFWASPQQEKRQATVRGRIRGIAQCVALVTSPYSRRELGKNSRAWMDQIKRVEDEGHARARLRG